MSQIQSMQTIMTNYGFKFEFKNIFEFEMETNR